LEIKSASKGLIVDRKYYIKNIKIYVDINLNSMVNYVRYKDFNSLICMYYTSLKRVDHFNIR